MRLAARKAGKVLAYDFHHRFALDTQLLRDAVRTRGLSLEVRTTWHPGLHDADTMDALGAHLAARVGARLIRPLLVVTSSAMAVKLLLDQL